MCPKLILWNNALINAVALHCFADARREGNWWGRLVENAVGAHLLNERQGPQWSITYWRDGRHEVDFVISHGMNVWALEVKSGRSGKQTGVEAFRKAYPKAKVWLLGADGVTLEEFFSRPAQSWFG